MELKIKILDKKKLTHDVFQFRTQKPKGLEFTPGQATELAINTPELKDEGRPFTFTSLPEDDHLEFTIKIYPSRNGMTAKLPELGIGSEFVMRDVFGAIEYKEPGIFIAGGAGITPFISIFRMLERDGKIDKQKLLFANKTHKDIILRDELDELLGGRFINVLSKEDHPDYHYGFIDKDFIKENAYDRSAKYYVCGPPEMMDAVLESLKKLEIQEENIITEDF